MRQYGFEIYSKKKQHRPHLRSVRFHDSNEVLSTSQTITIEMPQDISMFSIAKILLRYLAKHGAARTPFIFQQVATKESVKKLASAIISERDLDLSTYPIETIATTLKRILRALPVPIIHCQEQLFAILRDGSDSDESIPLMRTLLKNELHPDSFNFLADLIKLLAEIAASQQQTQMTASSLAYLFGPTLMRVKTDSTIALLHDPKVINRAVQFFIEHSEALFPFSKKTKMEADSSSKPVSKTRLLRKKIKMVLRRPFERTQAPNRNFEQEAASLVKKKSLRVLQQDLESALYASILLTGDELEMFREPPSFSPPLIPSERKASVALPINLLTPHKLPVNICDPDPSTESGRYRMQLDAAKAEQIFVENARRREMQFLDEERRAQEAFNLRRTYSENKEAARLRASSQSDSTPGILPGPQLCGCESDASTSSTRTSISSTSSNSTQDAALPPPIETKSTWWKDVQQLRDAAAAAASVTTPASEDIILDFEQPPSEPAPISPPVEVDEDSLSIDSISEESLLEPDESEKPKPEDHSDTASLSAASIASTESEPEQPITIEQSAPVEMKTIRRAEPSTQIAKKMQLFEQRHQDDDTLSSYVSSKSIRAPGGIIQRRAPVTKFKQIFETKTFDVDIDNDVRIIESLPRIELSGAIAVVRKDQWHAEAAREAPNSATISPERGYVQRIKNRLLSEPTISSPQPLSPSSRSSSVSNNSWNDDNTPNHSPKSASVERVAEPAIIRKLSITRVQILNRKLADRPQSMDLASQRSSISAKANQRASFSETGSLKPFIKGTKKDSIPEQVSTLPSGFYRIQNARRRDIRGGHSQFSASDDSDEDEEMQDANALHRSRPSLSATAFLRRLSTASSFADESVVSSRTASVQILDPSSRHGSQVFVPSVMSVSISDATNETSIRNSVA